MVEFLHGIHNYIIASVEEKQTCTPPMLILTACFLSVRSVTLLYNETTSSNICEASARGSEATAKALVSSKE
jgi:hypothetical protein